MVEQPKINGWLSEGIIIGLGSLFGYLIAYRYHLGFVNYFGIPSDFVVLSITDVIFAVLAIIMLVLFMLFIGNFLYFLVPKGNNVLSIKFLRVSIIGIFTLFYSYLYGTHWQEWIWLLGFFVMVLFLEYAFPLLTQRVKKSYREKLKAQEEIDAQVGDIYTHISSRIGLTRYVILSILLLLVFLSYPKGRYDASKKDEYLVTATSPEMAVLRIYGDSIICAPFDRATKKIYKRFHIIKMNEESMPVLVSEKVGPLSLED